MRTGHYQRGFTLPTVVIASVVMIALLALAMQLLTGTSRSLREQYYHQLAREAAEAGSLMANACLSEAPGAQPTWTAAKPLMPNTDCYGNVVPGQLKYLFSGDGIRTLYKVSVLSGGHFASTGVTENFSADSGSISRHYSWSDKMHFSQGASSLVDKVAFAYDFDSSEYGSGSHFGVIDPQGRAMTVGFNEYGQLGNGTWGYGADRSTPAPFRLPIGLKAQKIFTNFTSGGRSTFVVASDGSVYAAGDNSRGGLGIGLSYSAGESYSASATPKRVVLPSGAKVRTITTLRHNAFFLLDNYELWSTGVGTAGRLGNGSLSDVITPTKVNLPAPDSDATRPVLDSDWVQTTNLVADNGSIFLRTIGGRVYGWGNNEFGQLGNGTTTNSSLPVRVGSFGDPGQPKAKQLAFDGGTLYVVGDNGRLYVVGRSERPNQSHDYPGQLLGAPTMLSTRGGCLTYNGPNSEYTARPCSQNDPNQQHALRPDGMIGTRGQCLVSVASGASYKFYSGACDTGNLNTQWSYNRYHRIVNTSIDRYPVYMRAPFSSISSGMPEFGEVWSIHSVSRVAEVPLPAGTKAVRVSTDQRWASVLLDNGEVWSAGVNHVGQLGIGGPEYTGEPFSAHLRKMILPAGRKAVDIYVGAAGPHTSSNAFMNTFVVLDDGSVYGAGRNTNGNLGRGSIFADGTADHTIYTTPVKMALPAGVRAKSVQTGFGTTIVLSTDGTIYTVGYNRQGQLGDGTTTFRHTPAAHEYTNASSSSSSPIFF